MLDEGAYIPERAHDTDAGYDLRTRERIVLYPRSSVVVDTGVHIELPKGKCAVIMSKSGLNVNCSIKSTGLIDEGYTGSIKVKLYNLGHSRHVFEKGDKISQFFITNYYGEKLELAEELSESERGEDGFGSTGK